MITVLAYRIFGEVIVTVKCHHGGDETSIHVLSRTSRELQTDSPVEVLAAISDELARIVGNYVNSQGEEELTDECGR